MKFVKLIAALSAIVDTIQILLVVMKLTKLVTFGWAFVFIPLYIDAAFAVIAFTAALITWVVKRIR